MKTETATKKITQSGDSLVINVTKEVKRLGLDRGDVVDVTLSSEDADNLAFLNRIVNNAIQANDLTQIKDNLYYANYETVSRIACAVGDCCGNAYTVAIHQANGFLDIGVYQWVDDGDRAVLLLEVDFKDPTVNPDHDPDMIGPRFPLYD